MEKNPKTNAVFLLFIKNKNLRIFSPDKKEIVYASTVQSKDIKIFTRQKEKTVKENSNIEPERHKSKYEANKLEEVNNKIFRFSSSLKRILRRR